MALVKMCDSCGRVYIRNHKFACKCDGGAVAGIMTVNSAGRKDQKFDLCDDCIEKLWEWLDKSRQEPETVMNAVTVKDSGILYTSRDIDTDIYKES